MNIKETLLDHISNGEIKDAIHILLEILSDSEQERLLRDITLLSSRFNRNEGMNRKNIISMKEYKLELNQISNSLLEYVQKDFKPSNQFTNYKSFDKINKQEKVFISYSHTDTKIAIRLKTTLEENGVTVLIDEEQLNAGESIKSFIEASIKSASFTISLVSKNSLLSSWVAVESINALNAEKVSEKIFIAAYIDDSFFNRNFTDILLDDVEQNISEIQNLIKTRIEKDRKINDLQNELDRFQNLKHNLPEIIKKLKESFSVNLTSSNFDEGIKQILKRVI